MKSTERSHIVHVIDELRIGGAQTNLLVLLREMKNDPSIKVSVVCLFGPGELDRDLKELGINLKVFDFRREINRRNLLSPMNQLRKYFVVTRTTHVVCHLTWSRFVGLPAAFFAGVQARFGFEHGDVYLSGLLFKLGNFISQFFAVRIFVCSQFLAEWFAKERWVFRKKIQVIYLGVNPAEFRPMDSDPTFRRELGISDSTFLFCGVGTLGRGVNKRFDILIHAVSELIKKEKDVGLLICGDGDQRSDLQKLINELGVQGRIKLLGTRRDVARVMGNCQAFCHSAPFEPFGLVIVEAMLSGLPVIVPDKGGPSEITNRNLYGMTYKTLDVRSLTTAMKDILENKKRRSDLISIGMSHAKEEFVVSRYLRDLRRALRLDLRLLLVVEKATGGTGPSRNVVGTLNALGKRNDVQIELLCESFDSSEPFTRAKNIRIHAGFKPKNSWGFLKNIFMISKFMRKSDVVYVPCGFIVASYVSLVNLVFRKKVVFGPNVSKIPFRKADSPGVFEVGFMCDRWLEASNRRRDHVREHLPEIYKDRVIGLLHAIDLDKFSPRHRVEDFFAKFGARTGTVKVLHVGRDNEPIKGVHVLMNAIRTLNSSLRDKVDFLIVGNMSGETRKIENEFDNVKFLGFLSGRDLSTVYASSDLFVLASSWENCPFSVIESIASGVPVVGFKTGGIPEIVDANTGVLVSGIEGSYHGEDAAKNLAEALHRLITNDNLRNQMKISARKMAEIKFSEDRLGHEITEIFSSLLSREVAACVE
ncbi:MAG: hypothetical protein A4S09_00345 [Proteobacteria bacterium SG_bin7]|nr:MAG: hypothetical protein A4S09_00345 [Proteobacteria bacterium SG_bin7]